jgi:hypothetical protein
MVTRQSSATTRPSAVIASGLISSDRASTRFARSNALPIASAISSRRGASSFVSASAARSASRVAAEARDRRRSLLDPGPAPGIEKQHRSAALVVHGERHEELAPHVFGLLHEHLGDGEMPQPQAEQLRRGALGRLRRVRELDGALRGAAGDEGLRLQDHAPAEPAGDRPGLRRRCRDFALRHGDPGACEQSLALVFMEPGHGARW